MDVDEDVPVLLREHADSAASESMAIEPRKNRIFMVASVTMSARAANAPAAAVAAFSTW
jgi:hypothetical protein